MSEQWRFYRDCAYAQLHLSIRCSYMRMQSHLEGRDVWFLVEVSFEVLYYICDRTVTALARLRGCICDTAQSYLLEVGVWFLISFGTFYTIYERTVKAMARLRACAFAPESSLFAHAISTRSEQNVFITLSSQVRLKSLITVNNRRSRPE